MTQSELQFLQGLAIISVVSFIVKHVAMTIFNYSLNDEEKNVLENQTDGEIRRSTMVLGVIYYIAHCSFFLNTAILVAIYIKGKL